MPEANMQQFVLYPTTAVAANPAHPGLTFLRALHPITSLTAAATDLPLPDNAPAAIRVLDSGREHGAKLVELSPASVSSLLAAYPGLRLAPLVYFQPAVVRPVLPIAGIETADVPLLPGITMTVVSSRDNAPVPGAMVAAFTDFQQRQGQYRITNPTGQVSFTFEENTKLERLYVYPPAAGFWGWLKEGVTLTSGFRVVMTAVKVGYPDALRHFYGNSPDRAGAGVTVAVLDTGVASHPDLTIDGGANTVTGEDPRDCGDNGEDGHGTHVAGIIAAHGTPPSGIRGVAPAVKLRSYRVFAQFSKDASNFAIAKAIDLAVDDGCDLINMSLGSQQPDDVIGQAIAEAIARGVLVIVASGNDSQAGQRAPVSFPARFNDALAISAMGRKGTFPEEAIEAGNITTPFGTDSQNYLAVFSNTGSQIAFTAPGDGILSTVPNGYAPKDGTSMACPAITGAAARLLSARADILGMERTRARYEAMRDLLVSAARPLGFGAAFEGRGLVLQA